MAACPGLGVGTERADLPAFGAGVVEGGFHKLAGDAAPANGVGDPGVGDVHAAIGHLVVEVGDVAVDLGHEPAGNAVVGDIRGAHRAHSSVGVATAIALALVMAVGGGHAAVDRSHPRLARV